MSGSFSKRINKDTADKQHYKPYRSNRYIQNILFNSQIHIYLKYT